MDISVLLRTPLAVADRAGGALTAIDDVTADDAGDFAVPRKSSLRGAATLSAAQGLYVLSGYVLNVVLARFLGPGSYGVYGVVLTLLTIVNLMQTQGVPQALSRVDRGRRRRVRRVAHGAADPGRRVDRRHGAAGRLGADPGQRAGRRPPARRAADRRRGRAELRHLRDDRRRAERPPRLRAAGAHERHLRDGPRDLRDRPGPGRSTSPAPSSGSRSHPSSPPSACWPPGRAARPRAPSTGARWCTSRCRASASRWR